MTDKLCSISVDIDTLKDYAACYGLRDRGIACDNQVYAKALPRILDLFDLSAVKATFFVIGRDMKNPENVSILKEVLKRGHEIGNHTMNHILPFTALTPFKKKEEILSMQRIAQDKLGIRVKGFRAPGWGVDKETLGILEDEGYVYDSSMHPTCLMPLMNLLVILVSFGKSRLLKMRDCFNWFIPLSRFTAGKTLVEIPITVMPYLRLPFYGTFHLTCGKRMFDMGYRLLRRPGMSINYEMHASDILDEKKDNLGALFRRLPGFGIPLNKKKSLFNYMLGTLKENFEFSTLIALAEK
jgi:hypothetical protein